MQTVACSAGAIDVESVRVLGHVVVATSRTALADDLGGSQFIASVCRERSRANPIWHILAQASTALMFLNIAVVDHSPSRAIP